MKTDTHSVTLNIPGLGVDIKKYEKYNKAVLVSPLHRSNKNHCIEIGYKLGSSAGNDPKFAIYPLQSLSHVPSKRKLYNHKDDIPGVGFSTISQHVNIPASLEGYHLAIEVRSYGRDGFIELSGIKLLDNMCEGEDIMCLT